MIGQNTDQRKERETTRREREIWMKEKEGGKNEFQLTIHSNEMLFLLQPRIGGPESGGGTKKQRGESPGKAEAGELWRTRRGEGKKESKKGLFYDETKKKMGGNQNQLDRNRVEKGKTNGGVVGRTIGQKRSTS